MQMILRTIPGLEDLALIDSVNIGKSSGCEVLNRGVLLCGVDENRVRALLDQSRFITSASIIIVKAEISGSLDEIRKLSSEVSWEKYIPNQCTIAVRTERVGTHDFTSIDVNKVVGESIVSKMKNMGYNVEVHLNSPNLVITVDVIHDKSYIGLRMAGEESLHRKWYRVYEHPAALKPTIANALLELGELTDKETLLDPFCGGCTIPIEAALYHEDIIGYCNDISKKSITGAIINARVAGVENRIKFLNYDIRELDKILAKGSIDLIATNPPYGIRMGEIESSLRILRKLFEVSAELLSSKGRISFIYPHKDYVIKTAPYYGFKIEHERDILHGNLSTQIFILR